MARLNGVAAILRRKYGYRGYIHLKVIPGASDSAIAEAVSLASAVSLNIETPSAAHCAALSGRKDWERDIMRQIRLIGKMVRNLPGRRRVRQTTQFIVGASSETDREILERTDELYSEQRLERVYFSAYQAGDGSASIPGERKRDPNVLLREHRLYQSDFLIRKYGFSRPDLPFGTDGRLSLQTDPKKCWADLHPEFYPVRLRTAERWQLLRVPGLGPLTVDRIIKARRETHIRDAADLGFRGKRLELAGAYLDFS
jgi:predicted DNA-binding helix-hairpin-helix protein